MSEKWNIPLKVSRQKQGDTPHFDEYKMDVDPDEYVLDAVERVWAFMDRTVCFRHACHHSTCGACGMRVNNVEKLTCITYIRNVTQNGGTLKVEPLRKFYFFFAVQDGLRRGSRIPTTNQDIPPEAHLSSREDHQNGEKCGD